MAQTTARRALLYSDLLRLLLTHQGARGRVGPELSKAQNKRLTHQFVSALLAAGFPNDDERVSRSYTWLIEDSNGKTETTEEAHYLCLNKIEASIEMGLAGAEFCRAALRYLVQRRNGPAKYDIPDLRPSNFLSLWVAKILLAHGSESNRAIAAETVNFLAENYRALENARDSSLLLNLYSSVHESNNFSKGTLAALLAQIEQSCHQGLFDLGVDLKKSVRGVARDGLSAEVLARFPDDTYGMLMSTCYVIENLAPFCAENTKVRSKVAISAGLLEAVLDPTKPSAIRAFEEPYKQLMLAARAMIALQRFHGDSVSQAVAPIAIQQLVEQDKRAQMERSAFNASQLKRVVHSWLQVDWPLGSEQILGGGYSGASVVRVTPQLKIPSAHAGGTKSERIPGVESLVIKFGSKGNLDRERRNYRSIPPEHERLFAAIPKGVHVDTVGDQVIEYLIIEDLAGFQTIDELLSGADADFGGYVADRLVEFLEAFYAMRPIVDERQGRGPQVRDLYVTPIQRSLETIHDLRLRMASLGVADRDVLDDLYFIFRVSRQLSDFPASVMHGDLNTRNVLVHVQGVARRGAQITFKLIDLDRFSRSGDVVYDLGEFLVDNNVYKALLEGRREDPEDRQKVRKRVNERVKNMAREVCLAKSDRMYQVRLHLARARSLAKLLEIYSRTALARNKADVISRERGEQLHHRVVSLVPKLYEWIKMARTTATGLGVEWEIEDASNATEPMRVADSASPIGVVFPHPPPKPKSRPKTRRKPAVSRRRKKPSD